MQFNNEETSTATHGFRLSGSRVRTTIKPLDTKQKTLSKLRDAMLLAAPDDGVLGSVMARVREVRETLAASEFFAHHHLYDSSLLVVFDTGGRVAASCACVARPRRWGFGLGSSPSPAVGKSNAPISYAQHNQS